MPPAAALHDAPLIIGYGEALFDVIGEEAILGGAPSNFCVHVQQLLVATGQGAEQGRAAVVSRVGDDALGKRLREEVSQRGVDVEHLQVDPGAPTGTVPVTFDSQEQPTYEICRDVAWDNIAMTPELARLAARADAICFGTLVQRTATSRQTLRQLLAAAPQALRVCDLNLRQPYDTPEVIVESVREATVLKLNDEELQRLALQLGIDYSRDDVNGVLGALRERFPNLSVIAVTEGAAGARIFSEGRCVSARPPQLTPTADADSVGAGDAWCAALVVGLLRDLAPEVILRWANEVAAFVASQRGATPSIPAQVSTAWKS